MLLELNEKRLRKWIKSNGIYGYDPYDLFCQVPHFRKIIYSENILVKTTLSKIYSLAYKFMPLFLRKLFNVKKTANAKGIGLLGLGYFYSYIRTQNESDKHQLIELTNWLIKNSNNNYPGVSWGYPFDWQSRIFIPKGTPSIVVSCTVGDLFIKLFQEFGEKKYIDVALGVCEFILKGLNRSIIDDETICFSYTPLDDFQVHNANLLGAEFLVRVGSILNNKEFISLGLKASNYALKEQLPDGSLNYWGNSQNNQPPNTNDHYHVGFEIRSLLNIGKITENSLITEAAIRYYNYYLSNFFLENFQGTIPKMTPKVNFPLDIHACAESIILNCFVYEKLGLKKSLDLAIKSSDWIIKNMQNKDGSFAALKYRYGFIDFNIRIPYLRWGQAWMFYALNYLHYKLKNNSKYDSSNN